MQSPDQYLEISYLDSDTAGFMHLAESGTEEAGGMGVTDAHVQGETDHRLCWETIPCVDPHLEDACAAVKGFGFHRTEGDACYFCVLILRFFELTAFEFNKSPLIIHQIFTQCREHRTFGAFKWLSAWSNFRISRLDCEDLNRVLIFVSAHFIT